MTVRCTGLETGTESGHQPAATWVNTTRYCKYVGLPKISENLNIPRKPLALRTLAARCLFLYFSTNSLATGLFFFVSARVSEFWLFSLHHCHECLRLSKWRELRSKELALNFVSSSTKLHLRPTECYRRSLVSKL